MSQRSSRRSSSSPGDAVQRTPGPAPGKRSRTDQLQLRGEAQGDADHVHARAAEGTSDSGGSLPFLDAIQTSFGHHDVGGITAHQGAGATAAAEDIGARAYAVGDHVAFAGAPDLHTTAHEAAHVVQQRAGVHLKDGVGQSGDSYEQHADAVADLVVAGRDASPLLDQMAPTAAATSSHAVQRDDDEDKKPKKHVGGDAMGRLGLASKAIAHTKEILKFGAGNQMEAIRATNANSTARLQVMRDEDHEYWEISPTVYELINNNYQAFTAAKAELMDGGGGNCGEHADIAYDYLSVAAVGQTITKAQQKGFDHAFVLIGNLDSDEDSAIAVSDPWPTRPTAVVWEDHFAYIADRKKILRHATEVADGKSAKDVIKKGIKLTEKGKAMCQAKFDTKEETEDFIKKGRQGDHPWIWGHPNTARSGHDFEYTE